MDEQFKKALEELVAAGKDIKKLTKNVEEMVEALDEAPCLQCVGRHPSAKLPN